MQSSVPWRPSVRAAPAGEYDHNDDDVCGWVGHKSHLVDDNYDHDDTDDIDINAEMTMMTTMITMTTSEEEQGK